MKLNVKINDQIIFGRPNGEKTLATIVKINKSKLKVRQEEARGKHPVGTVWTVPPELCTTKDGNPIEDATALTSVAKSGMPSEWWIRQHKHELEVLANIYAGLSPENLSCDGEASRSYIREKSALLNRKLKAMFVVIERELDEYTTYQCLDLLRETKQKETKDFFGI